MGIFDDLIEKDLEAMRRHRNELSRLKDKLRELAAEIARLNRVIADVKEWAIVNFENDVLAIIANAATNTAGKEG